MAHLLVYRVTKLCLGFLVLSLEGLLGHIEALYKDCHSAWHYGHFSTNLAQI